MHNSDSAKKPEQTYYLFDIMYHRSRLPGFGGIDLRDLRRPIIGRIISTVKLPVNRLGSTCHNELWQALVPSTS